MPIKWELLTLKPHESEALAEIMQERAALASGALAVNADVQVSVSFEAGDIPSIGSPNYPMPIIALGNNDFKADI